MSLEPFFLPRCPPKRDVLVWASESTCLKAPLKPGMTRFQVSFNEGERNKKDSETSDVKMGFPFSLEERKREVENSNSTNVKAMRTFHFELEFSDLTIEQLNKVKEKLNADADFQKLPQGIQDECFQKLHAELSQQMLAKVVNEVAPPPEPKTRARKPRAKKA